jgi:hypothetical protein
MGPATAAGPDAVVARVAGVGPGEVVEGLAGRTLHVQLMRGSCVVHAGHARLLATRFVDGPSGAVETAFTLEEPLPRRVRQCFRRRRPARP